MKWTNKEYVDLMTYNNPKRPMFSELFGPLIGLDNEWRAQGATEDMIGMKAFAFDYVPFSGIGNFNAIKCQKTIVISDTDTEYVAIDHLGRRVRMDKTTATIPLPETYPVKNMDDWLKIKHMFVYDECRVSDDAIEQAKKLQESGTVIISQIPGGFDILRELMGEVNCCIAFYEDPELIFDILDTISDTNVKLLNRINKKIVVDQLSIHEDMAGKTAPMIGPATVEEFLKPYYLKAWELVKDNGTKLFCQDSDGNMNPLIDVFMECGVNIFYPCEPMGGMDVVELRKKYGKKIAFRGGIDKHVLCTDKASIDKELEYKMQPLMREGGIVFGLDHRIPNGVPLENYIYYVDRAREILGLPDFRICEPSWGRMAF